MEARGKDTQYSHCSHFNLGVICDIFLAFVYKAIERRDSVAVLAIDVTGL